VRRRTVLPLGAALIGAVLATASTAAVAGTADRSSNPLGRSKHLVVIYEENHSFDNLYGEWGPVNGQPVDGVPADPVRQVAQDGTPYACLPQNDVNLTSPPLSADCTGTAAGEPVVSHFANAPFEIDDYIPPTDTTCPKPGAAAPNGVLNGTGDPGGCTRDLVHRFYQEQYQLDGGKQDRYPTGSDAVGLTQGRYETTDLPIWQYLHGDGAPSYVLADRFFQGAFGGSFLNHQYLIAAQAPVYAGAVHDGTSADLHSVVDANGFPTTYPLYTPTGPVKDAQLTQACGPTANPDRACGDYAVNTIQPSYRPFGKGAQLPPVDDTASAKNVGDQLTDAGVSWAWYSGGWDNAAGNVGGAGWTNGTTAGTCTDPRHDAAAVYPYCADALFQYHHQPFNYFARYAPGTPDRAAHLKDEQDFLGAVRGGTLPAVSFVKPVGAENEHPGYASEATGSDHLVDLLKAVTTGPQAKDTLAVVTYDEFGGAWDHVPPPGQGDATPGPADQFGPGTRVPTLVVGATLRSSGVDHTSYDTTSIIATIERSYGLPALTERVADVADLRSALKVAKRGGRSDG
jgi:acid phosphatase